MKPARGPIIGRILLIALLVFLAAGCDRSGSGESVFYQPQERDALISAEQWETIFTALAERGTRTLVIQWTRYGDADFGGPEGWLQEAVEQAADAGLRVRIGLYGDPDWFRRLTDDTPRARLMEEAVGASLRQAGEWSHWRDREAFVGWYFPGELAGSAFTDAADRRAAFNHLVALRVELDADLAVSSYFQGEQDPRDFAEWQDDLARAGLRVWVQDGAGVAELPDARRRAYLHALPCRVGIIEEHFRQTSGPGEAFQAEPVPRAPRTGCHERGVFSLRYLPEAGGLLLP